MKIFTQQLFVMCRILNVCCIHTIHSMNHCSYYISVVEVAMTSEQFSPLCRNSQNTATGDCCFFQVLLTLFSALCYGLTSSIVLEVYQSGTTVQTW